MLSRRNFAATGGCALLASNIISEAFAQAGEHNMANIILELAVNDYGKWRPVFDKYKPLRVALAAVTGEHVYRNADEPNQVLVVFDTTDANKTMQVIQSDEVKAMMKEAGVSGPPKIRVVQ